MVSSGISGLSTSTDAAIVLFDATPSPGTRVVIVNTSLVQGFFSIDNGSTYGYLPAANSNGPSVISMTVPVSGPVLVKRVASGSNLTGLYGWSY